MSDLLGVLIELVTLSFESKTHAHTCILIPGLSHNAVWCPKKSPKKKHARYPIAVAGLKHKVELTLLYFSHKTPVMFRWI